MKKTLKITGIIVIALSLLLIGIGPGPRPTSAASGYTYYRIITIESDHIDSDLTDFTIGLSFTSAYNKTVANGGHVENTTTGGASGSLTIPADVIYCDDFACTNQYSHEIADYDATTGALEAWVEITNLDSDADQTFYMHYGNSSVTTNQEDISGTWSNSYLAVYHFADLGGYDSGPNGLDATDNASYTYGSGIVGYAAGLDADDYYTTPDNAALDFGTADFTLSGAFKVDNNGGAFLGYGDRADSQGWTCYIAGSSQCLLDDGTDQISIDNTTDNTDNTWRHFGFVADRSGNGQVYINGTSTASGSITAIDSLTSTDHGFIEIGRMHYNGGYPADNYLGTPGVAWVDEIRISSIVRTTDWLDAEYNSLVNNTSFISLGAEQTVTATATPTATATATATNTPTATATGSPTPTATATPPAILMGNSSVSVPSGLEDAVETALGTYRPDSELELPAENWANMWAITSYSETETSNYYWVSLAGMVVPDTGDLDGWDLSYALWTGLSIGEDTVTPDYEAHIDGSAGYTIMVDAAGLADIAQPDVGGTGSGSFYFPWAAGYKAYFGEKGVHDDVGPPGTGYGGMGWLAVDWVGGAVGYSSEIYPNGAYVSQSGKVSYVCKDDVQTWVQIGSFLYAHLIDNETLSEGVYHSQGSYLAALITGTHKWRENQCALGEINPGVKCGYTCQRETSYHLHWGFMPDQGYFQTEDWVLNTSTEQWVRGAVSVGPGQYMLAEWASRPIVPTPGPTVTPGGPTVTPGPIIIDGAGGGGQIWDGFIAGIKKSVARRTDDINELSETGDNMYQDRGIVTLAASGIRIAIRTVYVMLVSNLNLTISMIVLTIIFILEPIRLIRAAWLAIKEMIPFIG